MTRNGGDGRQQLPLKLLQLAPRVVAWAHGCRRLVLELLHPTRHPSPPPTVHRSCAFTSWSVVIGHASMATPAAASSSKFQPTARWRSISTCGAHPRITCPRDAVPASNPSGTVVPVLVAHTNAVELRANAFGDSSAEPT